MRESELSKLNGAEWKDTFLLKFLPDDGVIFKCECLLHQGSDAVKKYLWV